MFKSWAPCNLALILPFWAGIALAGQEPVSSYSVENLTVEGGAELVTIFQNTRSGETSARTPLLSVMRDTLDDDDPENDRLSYVWLLNNSRPVWWQRAAAALPFFYGRAGAHKDDSPPRPLVNVAAKHPGVVGDLGSASLQVWTFDPAGLALRASSRAYQGNLQNEQKSRFEQALAALTAFEEEPEAAEILSPAELERVRARLLLGQRRLGGLVSEDRFSQVSANDVREDGESRGRNWEILRQAAESNGLWFEPIALGRTEANYALISIRAGESNPERSFDDQFLRIRNPWADSRLSSWTGYTREQPSGETMIPLALYDLEYPRAPLLLVDFRDNLRPKKHEIFQRAITDLMKSVFGFSYIRDWYYYATRGAHDFVAGRHGAALDPLDRLRAYAKLKLQLGLDRSLDQSLRQELEKNLAHLALNPLESDFDGEARIAKEHYRLLAQSSHDPNGLPRKLEADRSAELTRKRHSAGERAMIRLGTVVSLGIYRHRERIDAAAIADLDLARRAEYHERFLRQALSSPRIEVDFDPERVRRSLEFLAGYKANSGHAELFATVFAKTEDDGLRRICFNQLQRQDDPRSRRELLALSRLPQIGDQWRELCLLSSRQKDPHAIPSRSVTADGGAAFFLRTR